MLEAESIHFGNRAEDSAPSPGYELAAAEESVGESDVKVSSNQATIEPPESQAAKTPSIEERIPEIHLRAQEIMEGRRLGKYKPPDPTDFQKHAAAAEQEQIEYIKRDINFRFGSHIIELVNLMESKGRLNMPALRKFRYNNPRLLKLLHECGYIDAEMEQEGYLDPTGAVAAKLITTKEIRDSTINVQYLTGRYRSLVKAAIDEAVAEKDAAREEAKLFPPIFEGHEQS
jgi:hypothetical protein